MKSKSFYFIIIKWLILSFFCFIVINYIQNNIFYLVKEQKESFDHETQNEDETPPEKKMKKYNVIFAGTIRNGEKNIQKNIEYIEECAKKFNDFAVVIYENDSIDNTRTILKKMKKYNYHYIFEDRIEEKRRTVRLANGRNKILEKVFELNEKNKYTYLIILDLDEIHKSGSFIHSIDSCFEYLEEDWDVITGNSRERYYDIWALRDKNGLNTDFAFMNEKQKNNLFEQNLFENSKYVNQNLIEVQSAFNGIGIYKLSIIKDCKYNGEYKDPDKKGAEKCEHVDFNKCIVNNNNGKLFINTQFLID